MFNAQSAIVVARRIAEPPAEPRHPERERALAAPRPRALSRARRALLALRRRPVLRARAPRGQRVAP